MKRTNAIKSLWSLIAGFIVILTLIFAYCLYDQMQYDQQQQSVYDGSIVIDLNEIEKLTENNVDSDADNDINAEIASGSESPAKDQIRALSEKIRNHRADNNRKNRNNLLTMYIVCVAFVILIGVYLHYAILRPFHKMERFADEIAKGNFNTELKYERHQFFGAFTWAFDSMRKEIMKARRCEKEAIENNKMVIATLSHDIKTPIASIRAYSEAMESGMDHSVERRARYLKVIMKKCDEVTELTNDLFIHSISDLDKLIIHTEKQEIRPLLVETVKELSTEKNNIHLQSSYEQYTAQIDRKRMKQVIGNIVGNSEKYAAGSEIRIWTDLTHLEDQIYQIHIRDFGPGISAEDMPFIYEKFYRGKNVSHYPGAGLGLYIVKYVMKQMDGDVMLVNHADGLEVILTLPVEKRN